MVNFLYIADTCVSLSKGTHCTDRFNSGRYHNITMPITSHEVAWETAQSALIKKPLDECFECHATANRYDSFADSQMRFFWNFNHTIKTYLNLCFSVKLGPPVSIGILCQCKGEGEDIVIEDVTLNTAILVKLELSNHWLVEAKALLKHKYHLQYCFKKSVDI